LDPSEDLASLTPSRVPRERTTPSALCGQAAAILFNEAEQGLKGDESGRMAAVISIMDPKVA